MLPRPLIDALVERTLAEDLGGGDLSAEACVDAGRRARAVALAKSDLVVCGGDVFRRAFELLDPTCTFEGLVADGEEAGGRRPIWRVEGNARALLMAERSALNLVQRMSGTATVARRYVRALPAGSSTRITDTRKTTPGLRLVERYAVRCGGAHNHRDTLGRAVLIKDNHLLAAGGVEVAVKRAKERAPHTSKIEVEVTSLEQLDQALDAGADIVMLDNFETAAIRQAVERAARRVPRPLLEASGGITLERIPELGATGVDMISVGALTHSAPSADISLDFEL
jgi:nicotinate-nucleotide pyrophosphorylase (carboxylating)